MIRPADIDAAIEELTRAGFLAPTAEAAELAAASDGDEDLLRAMVQRRTTGEPLAWITATRVFCGETLIVHPGVYVPRPQTEPMTREAVELLPQDGIAVDLCTGCGAIAAVLARRQPGARVVGVDLDPTAVACARANGIEAVEGDLIDALPASLHGTVDIVVGVVPYVPTEALHLLPRDVQAHEPRLALDGGRRGTALLERAIQGAAALLRPGGHLLLELGGDQNQQLAALLERSGFETPQPRYDDDGDLRSITAQAARPN